MRILLNEKRVGTSITEASSIEVARKPGAPAIIINVWWSHGSDVSTHYEIRCETDEGAERKIQTIETCLLREGYCDLARLGAVESD